MKKIFAIAASVALALATTGCMTVTPGWGNGGILGSLGGQGSRYVSSLNENTTAIACEKQGESTAQFLFGAIPLTHMGDITVATAAKNGGIKKIATIETKKTSILGIIVTYTTVVTGE